MNAYSVPVPSSSDKLVAFTDSGDIRKIIREDDNVFCFYRRAWFRKEDIAPLITGEHRLEDYQVKQEGPSFVIVRRKRAEINILRCDRILEVRDDPDPDVELKLSRNTLEITCSTDTVDVFKEHPLARGEMWLGNNSHGFYVTYKYHPEFVIQSFIVPFEQLLTGETITFEHDIDISNVSVYTKKYFESYRVEINK